MKKLVMLTMVLMFMVLVSIVGAHENAVEKSERGLLPNTNDTSICYPDLWSGHGLIHGEVERETGLLANYDSNFNTISPSRAVGAKIWPVLSYDDDDDDSDNDDGDDNDGDDDGGDDD